MDQSQLSPADRIAIIENALNIAKREKTGAPFYYILWGALLSLFALIHYMVLSFPSTAMSSVSSLSWVIFPLGGLLSFLKTRKDDKIEKVKPVNERLYKIVWGGVGLCFGVLTVFGSMINEHGFLLPAILMIFGFSSFIIGGVTRFIPLLIGGVFCVISAGLTMILPLAFQFLVGAIAMLAANFIPGILMVKMKAIDV